MQTGGNLSALAAFVACLFWYASVVALVALGQPLWSLVVLSAGVLRLRRAPHLVALLFTWPYLRVKVNPHPAPGQHYLGIDIGVVGLEWHPVCWARHRLLEDVPEIVPFDLGDFDPDAADLSGLEEAIAAAFQQHVEEWRRRQAAEDDDDATS